MKAYLLVVALAVTAACGKPNDAHVLQHEAKALAKYYEPRLDALEKRLNEIFQRGQTIPGNLPDVRELGPRLTEARDQLVKLQGIVKAGAGQASAIEQQAETAAKENRVEDLRKLVHDAEATLDRGVTIITANLDTVENWIAQYDRKLLANLGPVQQPSEPAPVDEPAAPEAEPAPEAGQAAPAAQPTPAQPTPAPAQPNADQPKAPAQP